MQSNIHHTTTELSLRHKDVICYTNVFLSPIGKIGLFVENEKLTQLTLLPDNAECTYPQDSISSQIVAELRIYFKRAKHLFNVDVWLSGTRFQQNVWHALKAIPIGQTITYGTLAKQLHVSPRAIGQACKYNPIPIIIPCHRVIAANGLGGYSGKCHGKMMKVKKWLLRHESLS